MPLPSPADRHAYLIGGGIASLAAAVFLIRDGQVPGRNIHIFEQANLVGGSLDGSGTAEAGYVLRGGRMLNFSYRCTYAMLAAVPSLEHPRVAAHFFGQGLAQGLTELYLTHVIR